MGRNRPKGIAKQGRTLTSLQEPATWRSFALLVVATQEQPHNDRADERNERDNREKAIKQHYSAPPLSVIQKTKTTTPKTIASA